MPADHPVRTIKALPAVLSALAVAGVCVQALATQALSAPQTPQATEIAALERAFDVRIMAEPGLQPLLQSSVPPQAASLDKSLDSLASRFRDGAWTALRLQAEPGRREPSDAKLAAAARALLELKMGVVYETTDEKRILALSARPIEPGEKKDARYLLFRRQFPPGDEREQTIADLQDDTLSLLESLDPDATPNPMRAWMEALHNLSPQQLQRVIGPIGEASNRLWDSVPKDQREQMLRDSRTVAERYGGGLMNDKSATGGPATASDRNYLSHLKLAAASLGQRYNVPILVEPGLFVSRRVPEPEGDLPLDPSLCSLLSTNRDIRWCRVHLPVAPLAAPDAARLASDLRFWSNSGLLRLESKPGTAGTHGMALSRDPAYLSTAVHLIGPDSRTVYLIYGVTNHRSRSSAARMAELLRRQMDRLMNMPADAMASAMADIVQTYQNTPTAAGRERIMALPVMAGMMAVWYPRAAKETPLAPRQ